MKTTVRVLIVDDNEGDALIVAKQLAQSTTTTFLADWSATYRDALDRLRTGGYEVCLVDYTLDEKDGLNLIQAALQLGSTATMIMLTGMDQGGIENAAIEGGAADYLVKGAYDATLLQRTIHHALHRTRLENELRNARDTLEKRVEARTTELCDAVAALQKEIDEREMIERQLRSAIIRLEQNNQAKTDFVTNVSHELKTPLTSMMYGIRNLLKGIAGPLPDHAIRYLKLFDSECQRLVVTINDILDLGKLDSQTLTLTPVTAPLGHLVKRCFETLRPQADSAGINMRANLDPRTPFVRCDPNMIQRVLHNLLGNALKFTPAGGTITLASQPEAEQAFARITVTDDGIGIPPEALERVTQRYFRASTHASGSGLGLAISKEIILLHGGKLTVTSPPPNKDRGTEITLTLPLAPPPTILVADNDRNIQLLLKRHLTSLGYQVITADSGQETILTANASRPDLILLDLVLEDIHGTTVILTLRGSPSIRYIPIIAITGATLDESTSEVLSRFSIPTLPKPWNTTELTETIEGALLGMSVFQTGPIKEIPS